MRPANCLAVLACVACAHPAPLRMFPDRAVAWSEHDDTPVAKTPAKRKYNRATFRLRDDLFLGLDGYLAVGYDKTASEDVNALDEVPCSTWYCPRNHLRPMSSAAMTAGPTFGRPPAPPFRVVEGKHEGRSPGVIIEDATGTRYIMKFDSRSSYNLSVGAEVVGSRFFHAAGWHVPAVYAVDFRPDELQIDPQATVRRRGRDVPLTSLDLQTMLSMAARGADGRIRASCNQWLEGEILGPFEYRSRRGDDPNDRIRHEDRRSLRASWLITGWLNNADGTTQNTLDVLVHENGRRFVRHYQTDFANSFGSWAANPKTAPLGKENRWAFARIARSLASFGVWERGWQKEEGDVLEAIREHPSVGYYQGEDWNPESFRTQSFVPAHRRLTERDAYWGAKVITAFTDQQIHAAVLAGKYPDGEARFLERALRGRRDAIARRYLLAYAAVERPFVQGERVCFTDIARERGYLDATARYEWRLRDRRGRALAEGRAVPAGGARGCLDPGLARAGAYGVLSIWTHDGPRRSKPTHVHVAWRASEQRWVVVGLERDEH